MTVVTVWLAVWLIAAVHVPLTLALTSGPSVEEAAIARALWLRGMTQAAMRVTYAASLTRRWKAAWPMVSTWAQAIKEVAS